MATFAENNFNVYAIPNVHVYHQVCRTNLPSNTAFRGFGVPQAFFAWQEIIGHIASELNLCPTQVYYSKLFDSDAKNALYILHRFLLKQSTYTYPVICDANLT